MAETNERRIKIEEEDMELWIDALDDSVQTGESTVRAINVCMRYLTHSGVLERMTFIQALLDDDIFKDILMSRNCGEKTSNHLKRARLLLKERCKEMGTVKVPDILSLAKTDPKLFKQFSTLYKFFGWDVGGDRLHYASARASQYRKRAEEHVRERDSLLADQR